LTFRWGVLDRQLDRTLYFVVRDEQGRWQFPQTQPERSAPLLTEAGEAHVRASYSGAEPPKLYFAGHGPAAVLKRGAGSDLPVRTHPPSRPCDWSSLD